MKTKPPKISSRPVTKGYARFFQDAFTLTFPKAVCLGVLACSFVMIKYRSPAPQRLSSKKHHHHLNLAVGSRAKPSRPVTQASTLHSAPSLIARAQVPFFDAEPLPMPALHKKVAPVVVASVPKAISVAPHVAKVVVESPTPSTVKKVAHANPLPIKRHALPHRNSISKKKNVLVAATPKVASHKLPAPEITTTKVVTTQNDEADDSVAAKDTLEAFRGLGRSTIQLVAVTTQGSGPDLDRDLDTSDDLPGDADGAVDGSSPLDNLTEAAFDEPSQAPDRPDDPFQSPVQDDPSLSLDRTIPREAPHLEIVGQRIENGFGQIRGRLAEEKGDLSSMDTPLRAPRSHALATDERASTLPIKSAGSEPQPTLVVPASLAHKIAAKPDTSVALSHDEDSGSEPDTDKDKDTDTEMDTDAEEEPTIASTSTTTSTSASTETDGDDSPTPARQSSGPALVTPAVGLAGSLASRAIPVNRTPVTLPSASPMARVTTPVQPTAPSSKPILLASRKPQVFGPEPMSTSAQEVRRSGRILIEVPHHQASGSSSEKAGPQVGDNVPIPGNLYFSIYIDPKVQRWLASPKHLGHLELYFQPVNTRDPQDTVFTDYQYPARDFQYDARGLHGAYHLMAGIFVKDSPVAVGQITYEPPISAENYKDKILFEITPEKFKQALSRGSNRPDSSQLSITLFEGASGNYRSPKAIANGSVHIVGFPEWMPERYDTEGLLRFQNIPSHSELLVEAEAPGFYPTYQIVPTFSGGAYSTISLISRDKVDAVRYFTHHPQRPGMAVVLGRIFNPSTRMPQDGQEVALSFRRGRALYFGALPDTSLPSTTDTGLFGFLNIVPSFRSLLRDVGKPAFLENLRPGTASYIELGRGGQKSFWGQLSDPFNGRVPAAKVRLVGDDGMQVDTDENGIFKIENIDFPPGSLTIEVEAPNYPLTWATFPWSTRELERRHRLFMMDKDIIGAAADSVARITPRSDLGSIVGGAEPTFFADGESCVHVALLDADGKAISKDNGPYPLTGTFDSDKMLCLSQEAPGFAFFNLPSGEYILKWTDSHGSILRVHVIRVGMNRLSVAVN